MRLTPKHPALENEGKFQMLPWSISKTYRQGQPSQPRVHKGSMESFLQSDFKPKFGFQDCCRGLRLKSYIPREFRSRWHYHTMQSTSQRKLRTENPHASRTSLPMSPPLCPSAPANSPCGQKEEPNRGIAGIIELVNQPLPF